MIDIEEVRNKYKDREDYPKLKWDKNNKLLHVTINNDNYDLSIEEALSKFHDNQFFQLEYSYLCTIEKDPNLMSNSIFEVFMPYSFKFMDDFGFNSNTIYTNSSVLDSINSLVKKEKEFRKELLNDISTCTGYKYIFDEVKYDYHNPDKKYKELYEKVFEILNSLSIDNSNNYKIQLKNIIKIYNYFLDNNKFNRNTIEINKDEVTKFNLEYNYIPSMYHVFIDNDSSNLGINNSFHFILNQFLNIDSKLALTSNNGIISIINLVKLDDKYYIFDLCKDISLNAGIDSKKISFAGVGTKDYKASIFKIINIPEFNVTNNDLDISDISIPMFYINELSNKKDKVL